MTTYEGNLLNALENIVYRDRSRKSLKSSDLDVLSLLSGDEEAVIYYLKQFHLKHPDKSTVIHTGKCIEVKGFCASEKSRVLYPDVVKMYLHGFLFLSMRYFRRNSFTDGSRPRS